MSIISDQKIISDDLFVFGAGNNSYNIGIFYKNYVFNKEYYPNQFDDWHTAEINTKYDFQGNIVYPRKSFLKEYNNAENITHKNLNFVVDAYEDLKNFFDELYRKQKLITRTFYTDINAQASYHNIENTYIEFVQSLYGLFTQYYISNSRTNNPHTFVQFVDVFILFLKKYLKIGVLNRSAFFKSKNANPNFDGLRISLNNESATVDIQTKANKYVGDNYFELFAKNIGRFGFFIDKNKPWSIMANLNSPSMINYAKVYGLYSRKDIIENAYHKAYIADLDNLKALLLIFWNNYCGKYAVSHRYVDSISCIKIMQETNNLNQITTEIFDKVFGYSWLIRFYIYTRLLEDKLFIAQEKFEVIVADAIRLYEIYGEQKSLLFINIKLQEINRRLNPIQRHLTNEEQFYKIISDQENKSIKEEIKF